jgi:hypothetical protein
VAFNHAAEIWARFREFVEQGCGIIQTQMGCRNVDMEDRMAL